VQQASLSFTSISFFDASHLSVGQRVISQSVDLGAVQRQETQLALDQVSLTLWQTLSSKHPVSAHLATTASGDEVVVGGRVVVAVNIRQ
jgi:hypothetical protein